jgi:Ser/Thr protein kinase RdoA (MazF antagonist)
MDLKSLPAVAGEFNPGGRIKTLREFGNGNINNTYLVGLEGGPEKHFILQKINTHVFRQPELVIRNMRVCGKHAKGRVKDLLSEERQWEFPRVISAGNGKDYWIDSEGQFWRALSFIQGARSFDSIRNEEHAREVGYALGFFHALLSDLPPDSLADTLPGFHITLLYLRHYDEVLAKIKEANSPEVNYCLSFISERSSWANVLEDAKSKGRLSIRVMHGDPKINNILMDESTGRAVSMIDLDTVKPGLVHYDIGDCLRSSCNPMGEEVDDWENVRFDPDLCRAVLAGYLSVAKKFLTGQDFEYIYDSIRLIPFELGLRFFTDYLEGNVYFKVRSPDHNLKRALVQFRLAESIEEEEKTIQKIIRDAR